jgi:hypothetical protein
MEKNGGNGVGKPVVFPPPPHFFHFHTNPTAHMENLRNIAEKAKEKVTGLMPGHHEGSQPPQTAAGVPAAVGKEGSAIAPSAPILAVGKEGTVAPVLAAPLLPAIVHNAITRKFTMSFPAGEGDAYLDYIPEVGTSPIIVLSDIVVAENLRHKGAGTALAFAFFNYIKANGSAARISDRVLPFLQQIMVTNEWTTSGFTYNAAEKIVA